MPECNGRLFHTWLSAGPSQIWARAAGLRREHAELVGAAGEARTLGAHGRSPEMVDNRADLCFDCRMSTSEQPHRLARGYRWVVVGLSLLHAAVFAGMGLAISWQSWSYWAVCVVGTAAAHLAAGMAGVFRPELQLRAWRWSSLCSFGLLALCTWVTLSGSAYLVGVYGALGGGLSAALAAAWVVAAFFTLPFALWGWVRGGGLPLTKRWWPLLLLLTIGMGGRGVWLWRAGATGGSPPLIEEAQIGRLAELLPPAKGPSKPLSAAEPALCPSTPRAVPASLVVSWTGVEGATEARCLQAENLPVLLAQAGSVVNSVGTGVVKLDLFTGLVPLDGAPSWLSSLALRPGLDGVCAGARCLMPWQLLTRGDFIRHRPLKFLKDLRFGVSLRRLSKALGRTDGLYRLSTESWLLRSGQRPLRLRRMRPTDAVATQQSVASAGAAAQQYILSSQERNGLFRYLYHPFTGKRSRASRFNIARQAGTTLALCELGERSGEVDQAIARSLSLLASKAQKSERAEHGTALVVRKGSYVARATATTLPLAAFLSCRERVGRVHDGLIGELATMVLTLQRPDGGFYPEYTFGKQRARGGTEPLYAPGQALLGLVLMEQQLQANPVQGWPGAQRVAEAVERGMEYTVSGYWPDSLYPFFFIEENWHCLAARAALTHHRHDGYERFCLDYANFKRTLALDSPASPDFVGGLGFGNVIPPHNTGTAGLAEALAAAMAVRRVRGEESPEMARTLKNSISFLWRQQWRPEHCFACQPEARGAMSEHVHSPEVRIDFVQHAWLGMAHGAEVLRL